MTKQTTLEQRFNKRFRPTYKRTFKENEFIEMPVDYFDWINALDHMLTFIKNEVERGKEEVKEMLTEKLLIKCECENGDCNNCQRLWEILYSISPKTLKK